VDRDLFLLRFLSLQMLYSTVRGAAVTKIMERRGFFISNAVYQSDRSLEILLLEKLLLAAGQFSGAQGS